MQPHRARLGHTGRHPPALPRAITAAALGLIPTVATGADKPYTLTRLTPLDTLDGSTPRSVAMDVSENGLVVGSSRLTYDRTDALRWEPASSVPISLGPGYAIGADAAGNVYGDATTGTTGRDGPRPVKWLAGSNQRVGLPVLPNSTTYSVWFLRHVREDGTVVGTGEDDSHGANYRRAFMWTPGAAQPVDLGTGIANDINSQGMVVGATGLFEGKQPWRLMPGAQQRELLHSFRHGSTYDQAEAHAVNDAGVIVGNSLIGPSYLSEFAAVWEPESLMPRSLPLRRGTFGRPQSWARDINNAGAIVGNMVDLTPPVGAEWRWAMLWVPGSVYGYELVDLESLADVGDEWHLATALGINDKGQITGWGLYDADGNGPSAPVETAFLMTPKPLLADANGDMRVNFADFQLVERNFGKTTSGLDPTAARALGDFDADGSVDADDFGTLQAQFGWWTPTVPGAGNASAPAPTTVPEPGLALAACALTLLLRRAARRPSPNTEASPASQRPEI